MMTREELVALVLEALQEVAPEADPHRLDAQASFRDQLEIDSVDYLSFVLGLEQRLAIKIPEMDYPRLSSLDGAVEYLAVRTGG
jgi:acyl carrier protein